MRLDGCYARWQKPCHAVLTRLLILPVVPLLEAVVEMVTEALDAGASYMWPAVSAPLDFNYGHMPFYYQAANDLGLRATFVKTFISRAVHLLEGGVVS